MAEGDDSAAVHDRYDALSHRFENEGGYDMVAEVDKALSGLGFDKAGLRAARSSELSGGQKNRAMLARAILSSPDVLLLDEPTNHLDFQAVEFLEEYLARVAPRVPRRDARPPLPRPRRRGDRGPRERPADGVLRAATRPTGGRRPSASSTATRAFEKQQEFIEKEKEYIRRNIAGVNSRQAKGRRTKLARVERLEKPEGDATSVDFRFDAARIGGRIFLRAKDLDAGYAAGEPDRAGRLLRAPARRAAGDPGRERDGQDDAR